MSDTEKRGAVLHRYRDGRWDFPNLGAMADRIVELEAAVERVRALHVCVQTKNSPRWCEYCNRAHPCATLIELEETP